MTDLINLLEKILDNSIRWLYVVGLAVGLIIAGAAMTVIWPLL